jgi:hypothetical protein
MLKGLLSDMTRLRKAAEQALLVLETSCEGLSVFLARKERDGIVLTPTDGAAAKTLCARSRGRAAPPPVVVCVPRRLLTIRYVSFPSVNPAEIERMARFEASELMPYSQRDTVYDHLRLGVTEAGYSDLLLAGIPRQKLEEFLKPLTDWGLEPDRVVPSSFALQAALSASRPEDRGVAGAVVLAEVDETGVETIGVRDGRLIFSREVRVSRKSEQAEVTRLSHALCESVHMALEPLHVEAAPDALISADPTTSAARIEELRQESGFTPLPVDAQRISERVRLSVPSGGKEQTPNVPPPSLRLLGLALLSLEVGKHPQMNLLPEETREKHKALARKRQMVRLGILGALCIALFLAASHAALARKERRIAALEAEISRISPEARQVEKKRMEIKLIKDQLNGSFLPFDLVMEFYKLTPDGVSLSQVSIDASKGITVHGQARALSQAFEYLAVLEHSDAFSEAEARYAEKRPVGDKEIVDFEVFLRARERRR